MSNKPIHFESFNYLANILYTSIGVDAYDKVGEQRTGKVKQIRRQLLRLIFFITIANLNWVLISELIFIILAIANNNNFVEATMLLSFSGFGAVADIKILSIWQQRTRINAMMRDLYALYPKTVAEQQLYDVKNQLKRYNRFGYTFLLLHEILVWGYNLFPLLSNAIYGRAVEKTLPYNCWTPFDWHINWRYYLMYITQIAIGQASVSGQMANDLLLIAVAVQLIMHYRQLAGRIEGYIAGVGNEAGKQDCGEKDLQFLRGVIIYHQKILNLSQALNDVFGISLFINFLLTSLIICFVLFQITIGASIDSLILLAFFLSCSLVQAFLICYYAQGLLEASQSISYAIYSHNWYDGDLRYKRMLIIIMQRSQKAAKMQATSFVTVSMPTMTDLLRISYKGFAVLRTIYARKS